MLNGTGRGMVMGSEVVKAPLAPLGVLVARGSSVAAHKNPPKAIEALELWRQGTDLKPLCVLVPSVTVLSG